MKQTLFLVIAAFFAAVSTNAKDGFVSTTVWSKYHLQDSTVLETRPVLQTFAKQGLGGGFYGQFFGSAANRSGYGNEIDVGIGKVGEIGGPQKITWDVSISYWDLHKLGVTKNDLVFVSAGLTHKLDPDITLPPNLTAGVKLEVYQPTHSSVWKGGYRGIANLTSSREVSTVHTLEQEFYFLRDDGSLGSRPVNVIGATLGIGWKLGKQLVFHPIKVKATWVVSGKDPGRKNNVIWGMGLSTPF